MPAALDLWHRAWLCHRCGGIFIPPASVSPATPAALTGGLVRVAEFQALVWAQGGYADLLNSRDWRENPRL